MGQAIVATDFRRRSERAGVLQNDPVEVFADGTAPSKLTRVLKGNRVQD